VEMCIVSEEKNIKKTGVVLDPMADALAKFIALILVKVAWL